MSFDFGKAVDGDGDGGGGGSIHRNISATSLSTTGHSRFHTIRMSRDDLDDESDSSQDPLNASSASSSSVTTGGGDYCCGAGTTKTSSTVTPSYMKSHSTHWTEFHLLFSKDADEELIKSHVHELSNIRFPLVWHPPPAALSANADTNNGSNNNKSSSSHSVSTSSAVVNSTSRKIASLFSDGGGGAVSTTTTSSSEPSHTNDNNNNKSNTCTPTPIAVHASFEVGAHLEHLVVQPKFTWTPVVQPNLTNNNEHGTNNNRINRRELLLSESAPPQIELLSIIRVNKPPRLDRKNYPYARLDRVCCITTNDPNYPNLVLECPSEQERDWLVFSIKLIVARLASIIITRDEDMLHEFFSPYSALMQLDGEDDSEVLDDQKDKGVSDGDGGDGGRRYEEVVEATKGGDRYDVIVTASSSSDNNNKRDREEVSTPRSSTAATFTSTTTAASGASTREEDNTTTRVVIVDDNDEVDYVFTDCNDNNNNIVNVVAVQEDKFDEDDMIDAIVEEAVEEDIDDGNDEEIEAEESDKPEDDDDDVIIGVDDIPFITEQDRDHYASCHHYHDRAHPSSPHGSTSQRSMSKTESPLRYTTTATANGTTTTTTATPAPHADGVIRTFSF